MDQPDRDETIARTERTTGFSPGQVLGERYRMVSSLGRGGMGEVWLAHDQKLRQDVALKALHPGLLATEQAREMLRDEVRAARQVISPSVCRIYDLIEVEGRELVSMEYVEGQTLSRLLAEESPLDAKSVARLFPQILSGLEAIHGAGLVHRDLKPDNVMISRAGRVVIMDFGVARMQDAQRETISGTPAYMSPEQARGDTLDARSDIYSVGLILAEMVHPGGARDAASRSQVWESARRDPPEFPETPWRPILRRALAPRVEERFGDVAAMAQAMEELHSRETDSEDLQPYPGLSPFTAERSRFFFGREIEVEAGWRRLGQGHLLALVGPSGAGKSSFLQAGLMAARPEGWRVVTAAPGSRPFRALAEAMLPEFAGDEDSLRQLLDLEELEAATRLFARWRSRHEEALLVLDQFEELFTQNLPEVRTHFAALIGRLVVDADVRILLSLRDDFLLRCQEHPELLPVFADLTPLGAPGGAALRRAIEQPALHCGYRFEDEALVEEMLAEVEGERGALPLLAFAVARLWERRDRERRLLTREAYHEIGGVAGALAQHAEATLEQIGSARVPVVRELFSNLVTAEGTRASCERDELLSVFENRDEAELVLGRLVDARLLTSYEPGEQRPARVEIVHESLLRAWPRLVRWQTQDAEGALLREQLRQVARIWDDRGRPRALLWTGTAYEEFRLWRERYVGGLTEVEREFSAAMVRHAEAARRRRRFALTGAFVSLLAVVVVVGWFWRQAEDQARIARASELVTRGSDLLEQRAAEALALARASLELRDSRAARTLAIEATWKEPPVFVLDSGRLPWAVDFSPDGSFLASVHHRGEVLLWPAGGGPPLRTEGQEGLTQFVRFHPERPWLVTGAQAPDTTVRIWSYPEGELVRVLPFDGLTSAYWGPGGTSLLTLTDGVDRLARWSRWSLDQFEQQPLDATSPVTGFAILPMADPTGGLYLRWDYSDSLMQIRSFEQDDDSLDLIVPGGGSGFAWSRDGGSLIAFSNLGEIRIFEVRGTPGVTRFVGTHAGVWAADMDPAGEELATANDSGTVRRWILGGPPGAIDPGFRVAFQQINGLRYSPDGNWLAIASASGLQLRFVGRDPVLELSAHVDGVTGLVVDPRGRWMSTLGGDSSVRTWALAPEVATPATTGEFHDLLDVDVSGNGLLLAMSGTKGVDVLDLQSGERISLEEPAGTSGDDRLRFDVSIDPAGERVAYAGRFNNRAGEFLVCDLASRETRTIPVSEDESVGALRFLPDGRLLCGTNVRLTVWDLDLESFEEVAPVPASELSVDGQGKQALARFGNQTTLVDLATGSSREMRFHGWSTEIAISPDGRWIATAKQDGEIRVSPTDGGRGYRYLRNEGAVTSMAFDPLGRWLITGGMDGTVRFWPMPAGEPMNDLPLQQLLQRLDTLTNIRLAEEPGEDGAPYVLDRFPGWAEPPGLW